MAKPGKKGLRRIIDAAGYSAKGLRAAWRSEEAFRMECTLGIILIPLGVIWGDSGVEKALLVASCLLVLVVELLNSAIEMVVDRIGPDYHELSGHAKDMGSAAVFLSMCTFAVIWGAVFWGHLKVS